MPDRRALILVAVVALSLAVTACRATSSDPTDALLRLGDLPIDRWSVTTAAHRLPASMPAPSGQTTGPEPPAPLREAEVGFSRGVGREQEVVQERIATYPPGEAEAVMRLLNAQPASSASAGQLPSLPGIGDENVVAGQQVQLRGATVQAVAVALRRGRAIATVTYRGPGGSDAALLNLLAQRADQRLRSTLRTP